MREATVSSNRFIVVFDPDVDDTDDSPEWDIGGPHQWAVVDTEKKTLVGHYLLVEYADVEADKLNGEG